MTRRKRYEFFILSITAGITGFVLYTIIAIIAQLVAGNIPFLKMTLLVIIAGYSFFSMATGIMFVAELFNSNPLKIKIILTVFFVVPLWLVMAGVIYSIPYGIYNFIKYRNMSSDLPENPDDMEALQ